MPDPTPTHTPTPVVPWYQTAGLDAEHIGHAETKGWAKLTPDAAAVAAIKAHREAERAIGIPANRVLKLPENLNDSAAMGEVWSRLGKPKDAASYDFKDVKRPDGKPLDDKTIEFFRQSAFAHNLPQGAAADLARDYAKMVEAGEVATNADYTAKVAEAQRQLDLNWGPRKEANMFIAKQAAAKLGLSPEFVAAAEKDVGFAKIMESLLQTGVRMGEDKYIAGAGDTGGGPMSADQAESRKKELMLDEGFKNKIFANDSEAIRTMNALNEIIVANRQKDPNRRR